MREKIVAGNIYHILNRGVDKRKIFLDDKDHLRFIHDLFEFNDVESANNLTYYFHKTKSMDIGRPYIIKTKGVKQRKLLVHILAFCLMPNHYHLLVKPLTDEGMSKFMKKLNMGYSKYFNEKYQRSGALFEGRYKSIAIKRDSHLVHIPYYIHLNPLDLLISGWRKGEANNTKKVIKFLENYRWSSFLDYIGRKNFPSLTQRELLLNFFGGPEEYKKEMIKWLKERNIEEIKNTILE